MPITVVKETPSVRVGVLGPLLVNVWFTEATVAGLEAITFEQRALASKYGKVTILALATQIPRSPSREAADYLKESQLGEDSTLGTVIALLTRGLGAVFARSFIAAISLFSTQRYIVVKDLAEAARSVRALPGQAPEVASHESLEQDLADFLALPPPK